MDPITDKEDVKYYLGRFYFQNKDYEKAIKEYEKGLIINPKSIILLYEIGLVYFKLGNHKKVLRYWRKLLKMYPHSMLASKVKCNGFH